MTAAEYPTALWMPAHPSNFHHGRIVKAATRIVCHCTDGHAEARGVGEMWQQTGHGTSANFCVGQAGEVIQSVSINDTAWHAHAANSYSVGIEHCARTPGEWGKADPGLAPSDKLYASSAQLCAWLCLTLGFLPSRVTIIGHAEADPATTHTRCPDGCGWNWPRYMRLVTNAYEALKVQK
jgi:N-acetyl-anhydromuramyl-L-alanine amidase AmpD